MNNLNDLKNKLSDNLMQFVALGLIVLVGFSNVFYITKTILPALQARSQLTAELDLAEQTLTGEEAAREAQPETLRSQVASRQSSLAETAGAFMTEDQAAEFVSSLYTYAEASSVGIADLQVQPSPRGDQTTYEIRVLRVEATGSFDNLTRFVTQIKEATVPTVVINKLDLKQEDESAALAMELQLYTSPLSAGGINPDEQALGSTLPLLAAGETAQVAAEGEAQPETPAESPAPAPTATPAPATPPVCDCSANLYNCANFSGPQEAQVCYDYCRQTTGSDVHLLDADRDGVVCESVWPGWNLGN
jgi:Tfp pilus assembly protein PilO